MCASASSRCRRRRRGWPSSATTSVPTVTSRWRGISCAAQTACASSRIRASRADARLIPHGRSVPSVRRRSAWQHPPRGASVGARARRPARRLPPSSLRPPDPHPISRRTTVVERTLILVKPDAFARNLTGEIITRFERKGLRLAALQQMTISRELAGRHYAEHEGKPFYGELVDFITSGPLVAMVLEGEHAIVAARQVIGATNPLEANTGSIRGDYALEVGQNMVHG